MSCHRARIVLRAGVERRLTAAGLALGHEHLEARALENVGGGEPHARVEVIDEAGHQQLHGPRPRRVRSRHAVKLNPDATFRQQTADGRLQACLASGPSGRLVAPVTGRGRRSGRAGGLPGPTGLQAVARSL